MVFACDSSPTEAGSILHQTLLFQASIAFLLVLLRGAINCWGNHEPEAKKCLLLLHYFRCDAMSGASSLSRQPYLCLVMFFRERDTHFTLFWFVRKHWDGMGWNFGTQLELIDWIYLGVNCDLFGHFHMWDGAWGMFFIRRENLHFSWLRMSD